ncbi:MAG: hypothetical protein AABX16_00200, partial [Nanoarchaeota archaeon]
MKGGENMTEEGSITIKKQDLWKYSTFVLLAIVVIGGIYMYSAKDGTNVVVPTNPTNPTNPTAPTQPSQVSASV